MKDVTVSSELQLMTKTERAELGGIIKRNFRIAKAGIEQQKARVLADFEAALARQWDPVELACEELSQEAKAAVERVNEKVAAKFQELGLPRSWAPRARYGWEDRGETVTASRRAELRRVAQARAEEQARTAKLELDRREAEVLTELATSALTSEAAKAFFARVPTAEELMPAIEVEGPPLEAVNALLGRRAALSTKRAEAGRSGGRAAAKARQLAAPPQQVASDEAGGSVTA